MNNKACMLSGKEFNTSDPELMADKARARIHVNEYNAISDNDVDASAKREKKLQAMFGGCGEQPFIKPPFHCDYGYQIFVGDHFFANFDCVFLDAGRIIIGNHCMIGPKTVIAAITHPIDPVERNKGIGIPKDVLIGDNVWIGANVTILPGVEIGDCAVVGAGSVVTKNVPANTVVAGNPAVVIREI